MKKPQIGQDLVSVIIPIYNREDSLRRCVKSVLEQTYRRLQIILVDDGSIDGSARICDDFAQMDQRVEVLHQHNGGVSSARNHGLDLARGEFITFIDADDFIHHRFIELLYNASEKNKNDIVVGKIAIESEYTRFYEGIISSEPSILLASPQSLLCSCLVRGKESVSACAKIYRRSLIEHIRFKDLSLCEDAVFLCEALLLTKNDIIIIDNTPLYYYVMRNDSAIHTMSPKHLQDSLKSARWILELSKTMPMAVKNAAICYAVNSAFYAYFQSKHREEYERILSDAMKLIKKYRIKVLLDQTFPFKTKAACLFSMGSMAILERIYNIVKRKENRQWKHRMHYLFRIF